MLAPASFAVGCSGAASTDSGEKEEAVVSQRGQAIWNGHDDLNDPWNNAVVRVDGTWGDGTGATEGTTCTGILLTTTLVLTARHCVDPFGRDKPIRVRTTIRIGVDSTHSPQSFLETKTVRDGHIWMMDGDRIPANDVALMELVSPVRTAMVFPHRPGLDNLGVDYGSVVHTMVRMVGWGLTEPTGYQPDGKRIQSFPTFRQAQEEVLDVARVQQSPGGIWTIDYANQAVPYSYRGTDIGDSGGPLYLRDNTEPGFPWQLVGVTSGWIPWGDGEPHRDYRGPKFADITSVRVRTWLEAHAADPARPGKWLGETDYEGPCEQVYDRDCDRYYDHDPVTGIASDTCPGVFNPDQRVVRGPANPPDTDGDGVFDSCDNCPTVSNPDQADTNGDGLGDACDAACNHDPGVSDYHCCDDDSDCPGDGNACVAIEAELQPQDAWGTPVCASNKRCALPINRDGDDMPDSCDNCPTVSGSQLDTDGDGVGDVCDRCPGTHDFGPHQEDQAPSCDYDGTSYAADFFCMLYTDDVDSVCNFHGKCTGGKDSDGDGLGDACDGCPNDADEFASNGASIANCNADMERELHIYPPVGDVCDPTPCSYSEVADFERVQDSPNELDLSGIWNRVDYRAITLPRDIPGAYDYQPENGRVRGTVGARYCECTDEKLHGKERTPHNCAREAGCAIATDEYLRHGSQDPWQVPHLVRTSPGTHWLPGPYLPLQVLPEAELTDTLFANPRNDHDVPELIDHDDPAASGVVAWRVTDLPTYLDWPHTGNQVVTPGRVAPGVYWTHVTEVHGMTTPFQDLSNHYEAGIFGIPAQDTGKVLPNPVRECGHLCIDMCPMCHLLDEVSGVVIDPVDPVPRLYAVNSRGVDDLTDKLAPSVLEALADDSLTWIDSAELGRMAPRGSAAFALVDPGGSRVGVVARVLGGRAVDMGPRGIVVDGDQATNPAGNGGSDDGTPSVSRGVDAESPTPRSHAAVVLSSSKNMLFVVGGKDSDGHWADTLRTYDPATAHWAELPLHGDVLPRRVLAATYHPATHSLIVLDQKRRWGMRWARMLRIDVQTRHTRVIGMWPRLKRTKVYLSLAENGTLLLAASHRRRTFVVSFDMDERARHVHPRWVWTRRGKLAYSPTLTHRGLTVPMKRHGRVVNTFVPATDLHGTHHQGFGSCL